MVEVFFVLFCFVLFALERGVLLGTGRNLQGGEKKKKKKKDIDGRGHEWVQKAEASFSLEQG